MDQLIPVFLVGGILALIGAVAIGAWYSEKKRAEALEAWARDHAFTADPNVAGFEAQVQLFKLFSKGHRRRVTNLLRSGREGMQLSLCDYRYMTGSGKNSQTHTQTVCAITAAQSMPMFYLRRQLPFLDSLGKLLGGQDINFDEAPEFSKAFVLQTDGGEEELRRFFTAPTRDAFVRLAPRFIQAEAVGGTLLVHYGRRLKVAELDQLVADAVNLRRALMR